MDLQTYLDRLTPVEQAAGLWIKRDDLFALAGVQGGKVRTCAALAIGADGLVTAGGRGSPQANIVAHIAAWMGIPARVHVPAGSLHPEVVDAGAVGAKIVQHTPGYNTVIVKRAEDDSAALGWRLIPFGMECPEAVRQTAGQVANLPPDAERIVVPVGSGMSLAGILTGMASRGDDRPVLGVVVGADPIRRLDRYAPRDWRDRATLVKATVPYATPVPATLGQIVLDPHYEAKVLPYLLAGDCLWIVGISRTAHTDRNVTATVPRNGAAPGLLSSLRISAAWGRHRVNCTLDGILAECHGGCCYGPTFWPGRSGGRTDNGCHYLGDQGCTLSDADKPVTCHLYPLVVSKAGTLVLHNRIPQPPRHQYCGANYGTGPMAIEAVQDSLRHLLGPDVADRIVESVREGRDIEVDLPADVAAALVREHAWAESNTIPVRRSEFGV